MIALGILQWRRAKIGGEFGGPAGVKMASSAAFAFGWVIYVTLSSLFAISAKNDWQKKCRLFLSGVTFSKGWGRVLFEEVFWMGMDF